AATIWPGMSSIWKGLLRVRAALIQKLSPVGWIPPTKIVIRKVYKQLLLIKEM
ncbi:hypothetical protein Ancab_029677, partial [Ancistrocladus abbreviatus]